MLFNMYYVVSDFNFYLDRNMVLDDLVALDYQRQEWLAAYVKSEFLFVGISTTISTFLVIFHFVRLLWKQINNR